MRPRSSTVSDGIALHDPVTSWRHFRILGWRGRQAHRAAVGPRLCCPGWHRLCSSARRRRIEGRRLECLWRVLQFSALVESRCVGPWLSRIILGMKGQELGSRAAWPMRNPGPRPCLMTASQSSALDATPRRRVAEVARPVGSSARSRYRTNISGDGRLSLRNFVFRKKRRQARPAKHSAIADRLD
jgi:hypothetical protein